MKLTMIAKTDFIKFNVSPVFKQLAAKKAQKQGLSLSELGRLLFGSYVFDMARVAGSKELFDLAEKAREDYRLGNTKSFTSAKDIAEYLDSLR